MGMRIQENCPGPNMSENSCVNVNEEDAFETIVLKKPRLIESIVSDIKLNEEFIEEDEDNEIERDDDAEEVNISIEVYLLWSVSRARGVLYALKHGQHPAFIVSAHLNVAIYLGKDALNDG